MGKFSINIDNINSPKRKKYWIVNNVLGLVWTANGITNLIRNSEPDFFSYFYLIVGPLLIITSINQRNVEKSYHISYDDDIVKARTSFFKKVEIQWKDIKKIVIKNLVIEIITSNKKEEIKLDLLPYIYVKEVKSKFIEAAKLKNVEINE